jgi:hypothetical protein
MGAVVGHTCDLHANGKKIPEVEDALGDLQRTWASSTGRLVIICEGVDEDGCNIVMMAQESKSIFRNS